MAWYCSGSTNAELVENLFNEGLIKDERVKEAMIKVSSYPSWYWTCTRPTLNCNRKKSQGREGNNNE